MRVGGSDVQPEILNAMARLPIASLSDEQQIEKLRLIEVTVVRQGKPAAEAAQRLISELSPAFPAKSQNMNRELCQILLALDAPDAVAKTMKLLENAPTQEEQVVYVLALRTIKSGWTPESHRQYLAWWTKDRANIKHADDIVKWFDEAGRPYGDGASFNNFVAHLHADAVASLTAEEKTEFASVISAYNPPGPRKPKAADKPRTLVKAWTTADLAPLLPEVSHGRSFAKGKAAFEAAQCLACHKFGNDGGAVGPDLTAVSSRFKRQDILESITEPSKVLSEQYANTTVRMNDGDAVEGRIVEETADKVVVQTNPLAPDTKVTLKKADIKSRALSKLSPMPEGLLNSFKETEILDLIAYIESGGRKDHPDFVK